MRLGLFQVKTPRSRSSASLVRVTRADQWRDDLALVLRAAGRRRALDLRVGFLGAMVAYVVQLLTDVLC